MTGRLGLGLSKSSPADPRLVSRPRPTPPPLCRPRLPQAPLQPIGNAHALSLFGLAHFEQLVNAELDTRALLGWADGLVVVGFRGTASRTNVLTDVKAWQVVHAPRRLHGGSLVKVHAGFYEAWTRGGYGERLMAKLQEIVDGFSPGSGLRFLLTGHSLGGALAALAAHAIAARYRGSTISVYSFGAPRLGNRAWKAEYLAAVPDTWEILHDQDPIPRVPAHGHRSGRRVIVNTRGDVTVRPSFFELSVINRSGGVAAHHRMRMYALALACVMKAQVLLQRSLGEIMG